MNQTMRNFPEPELDPTECVDSQGTVWPEHKFKDSECVRCGAEPLPEEFEEFEEFE